MTERKIWVTGSRGFIGRYAVAELKKCGCAVRCFSNAAFSNRDTGCAQDIHPLDYESAGDIQRQINTFGLPDTFIHLAWAQMTQPDSGEHLDINVRAGKALIDALFAAGLRRFVFIGSMNEYGGRVGSLSEDMLPDGSLTNYARGKIKVATHGFQSAKQCNRFFIHIRSFYVFGAGQRQGSLINDLYQAAKNATDVKLGPCAHYRDFVHANDVATAIRLLSGLNESATVNVGSGTVIQVKEYVKRFWEGFGADPARLKFGALPMRANEPAQPQSYADLTLLKKLTGWLPALTLEQGIQRTIDDLRKNELLRK